MYIYPGDMIAVLGCLSQNQMRGQKVILEIRLGDTAKMTRYGVKTGCEAPYACMFLYKSAECKAGALSV